MSENNRKNPYFIKRESDFMKQDHYFVGYYVSDNDFDFFEKLYPNECYYDIPNWYNISYKNTTISDYLLDKQELRIKWNDFETELHNKIKFFMWDFQSFLSKKGYFIVYDNNFSLKTFKGLSKPNKHTKLKMLSKNPKELLEYWETILNIYVRPLQNKLMELENELV